MLTAPPRRPPRHATVTVAVTAFDIGRPPTPADFELLSPDEQARAGRFRFDRDRSRFVVGRATLRRELGARLDADPSAIAFTYNTEGKPDVAQAGIAFNLSNSDDLGVLAVAAGAAHCIGVDVEMQHSRSAHLDELVARRFFAPGEVERLLSLPGNERSAAFLRCWTRKEALLKALGGGLTLPLHDFEVTLEAEQPARILYPSAPLMQGEWTLADVSSIHPRCQAAVAVRAPKGTPVILNLNPGGGTPS